MNAGGWITIIDVCREIGVEPEPNMTWSVGARVRDLYEASGGTIRYALRQKTNGGGSHQFAIYPPSWRERIVREIRRHGAHAARQGSLF